jgi:TIR domain
MVESTDDVPARIFISYRRGDTAYPAAWLFDQLASHFGRDRVFKDIDSIALGQDFIEAINAAVGSCDVLLALIGERWLRLTHPNGRLRLNDPGDFVRLEIETALARDVRVIPILVEGAQMPRTDELPASLAGLTRRQALELSPGRFEFDTRRLLMTLDRTIAEAHDQARQAGRVMADSGRPLGSQATVQGGDTVAATSRQSEADLGAVGPAERKIAGALFDHNPQAAAERQRSGADKEKDEDSPVNLPVGSKIKIWQLRVIVAVIVMVGFWLWISWQLGLTLAVIVIIADVIYRSRRGTRLKYRQRKIRWRQRG